MAWTVNNDPDQIVLFAGGQLSLSRYVTDLKAAGGMYYTIPSISLTDFEIEFEIATTHTANKILMGDSHLTSYYFNFGYTYVSAWIAGSERFSTVTAGTLTDGKIHKITWSLVGTTLKLSIDGTLKQTWTGVTGYTGVNSFRIGTSNSISEYLSGSFFSTKIWSGGDRGTGALVRDYRFNDNNGVLVDYSGSNANGSSVNITAADRDLMKFDVTRNAWVGGEQVSLSTQSLTYASAFEFRGLVASKQPVIGYTYLSSFKFDVGDGGVRSRLISSSTPYVAAPSAAITELGKAVNGYYPIQSSTVGTKYFSNISLKRIIEVAQ